MFQHKILKFRKRCNWCYSKNFSYLEAIPLSTPEKRNGFSIFIFGLTDAVTLYNDSYYLFDSRSRILLGQIVVNGQSVLLKFFQLNDLEKYIQIICLLQRNIYFQIQYTDVIVGGDWNDILRDFHHKKKLNQQMKHRRDKISQEKQQRDLSLSTTVSQYYSVLKSVQGSYNQQHESFSATAGMQCTCISLFSLCWSVISKVSIWQSHSFDYILTIYVYNLDYICTGGKIYKDLGASKYFNVDDLPVKIYLLGQSSDVVFHNIENREGSLGRKILHLYKN